MKLTDPSCPAPVVPPLFGLAPGGVCPASAVTGAAVRSYRTISPLPDAGTGKPGRVVGGMFLWHFPWGRPRRPLAATAHPWSPDFPPPTTEPEDLGVGRDRPTDWHGADRGHMSLPSRLGVTDVADAHRVSSFPRGKACERAATWPDSRPSRSPANRPASAASTAPASGCRAGWPPARRPGWRL